MGPEERKAGCILKDEWSGLAMICDMGYMRQSYPYSKEILKLRFICILFLGVETWHKSHYLTGVDICYMAGQAGAVWSVPSPLSVYWLGHIHMGKCKECTWHIGQGSRN